MELDLHRDSLHCKNCADGNDFISHGFVFEICLQGEPKKVGKRLLCANRHGRSGCGATLRLYLSTGIPRLKHSAIVMTLFFAALLRGLSIQQAYQSATRLDDPRRHVMPTACSQRKSDSPFYAGNSVNDLSTQRSKAIR